MNRRALFRRFSLHGWEVFDNRDDRNQQTAKADKEASGEHFKAERKNREQGKDQYASSAVRRDSYGCRKQDVQPAQDQADRTNPKQRDHFAEYRSDTLSAVEVKENRPCVPAYRREHDEREQIIVRVRPVDSDENRQKTFRNIQSKADESKMPAAEFEHVRGTRIAVVAFLYDILFKNKPRKPLAKQAAAEQVAENDDNDPLHRFVIQHIATPVPQYCPPRRDAHEYADSGAFVRLTPGCPSTVLLN